MGKDGELTPLNVSFFGVGSKVKLLHSLSWSVTIYLDDLRTQLISYWTENPNLYAWIQARPILSQRFSASVSPLSDSEALWAFRFFLQPITYRLSNRDPPGPSDVYPAWFSRSFISLSLYSTESVKRRKKLHQELGKLLLLLSDINSIWAFNYMDKSWILDGKGIAKKVKNATLSSGKQVRDCGAVRQCPNCHYWIDNSDVPYEWPGLPVGVKFDPSDAELLEHLAAKCGVGNAKPHMFIDEFIPTLDTEKGICYTHPKYLPGAKKDGSSTHFFHRIANAYASGKRKRRKIQNEKNGETVRWHKTGRTKPVIDNGVQKGYKKIMVLYRSSRKGSKPVKSNWVMHQYHLGSEEDEKDGDYVVSRISYQQKKRETNNDDHVDNQKTDCVILSTGPKTPSPPRFGNSLLCDDTDITDNNILQSTAQAPAFTSAGSHPPINVQPKEDIEYPIFMASECQAFDPDPSGIKDPLLCKEIFSSCGPLGDGLDSMNNINGGAYNGPYGISVLENLELDTQPDFQLADLQFGSQDSVFGWLDQL